MQIYWRLLKLIFNNLKNTVWIVIYSIACALAAFSSTQGAIFSGKLIQELNKTNNLVSLIVVMAVFKSGQIILDLLNGIIYGKKIAERKSQLIRNARNKQLLKLNPIMFLTQNIGEFNQNFDKAQTATIEWLEDFLIGLAPKMLIFLASTVSIFLANWQEGLVFISGSIIYGSIYAIRNITRSEKERQLKQEKTVIESALRNFLKKVYASESSNKQAIEAIEAANKEYDRREARHRMFEMDIRGNLNSLIFVATEVAMALLSLKFPQNAGSCMVVAGMLLMTIRMIVYQLVQNGRNATHIQEFFNFLDAKPIYNPTIPTEDMPLQSLAVNKITVDYPAAYDLLTQKQITQPKKGALVDVSFQIEPGQIIGVCGRSGAGKTTLIDILSRYYRVTNGNITIGGIPLGDIREDHYRVEKIDAESPGALVAGTLRANLTANTNNSDEEISELLESLGLHIIEFENGLDTMLREEGKPLSTGQRKRVSIAKQLLKKPNVLLADEITANLDTVTGNQVLNTIFRYARKEKTFVFLVTHNLSELKFVDKVLFLQKGKLVASGTYAELLSNCESFKELTTTA